MSPLHGDLAGGGTAEAPPDRDVRRRVVGAIGAWDWDLRRNRVRRSAGWARLFGLDERELPPGVSGFAELLHPDDRQSVLDALDRAIAGTAPFEAVYRAVWPDGSAHWLEDRADLFRDARARPARLVGAVRGMSSLGTDADHRRVHAERDALLDQMRVDRIQHASATRALAESEERYRAMGETLPYGVWMSGPDGGFRHVSRSFLNMAGVSLDQMRERGWAACLPREEAEVILAGWRQSLSAGGPWEQELRVVGTDGAHHTVLSRGMPVRDYHGRISCWVGINLDITERKSQERRIEALIGQLQRAVSETHHRVKNNLQVVAAMLDLRTMGAGESVPVGEVCRIAQHVRGMAAMHDLLTHEADRESGEALLSARRAMDRMESVVQHATAGRVGRFDVSDFSITGRQATAIAVLVNELVSNALKHGGQRATVALSSMDGRAYLEVRDDGPGFPEDFGSRLERHTGLELVESLSRLDLQGEVLYANGPEGGARVTVAFPLDPQTESPDAPT